MLIAALGSLHWSGFNESTLAYLINTARSLVASCVPCVIARIPRSCRPTDDSVDNCVQTHAEESLAESNTPVFSE